MEAQNPAIPILRNEYKTLVSHKSVSYDVVYKSKFGFRDSVIIRGKVKMMPIVDTVFEGHAMQDAYLWWAAGDTEFQIYNLVNGYDINTSNKVITKCAYKKKNEMHYNCSLIDWRMRWLNFINPKDIDTTLWAWFNDTIKLIDDTFITGIPCWHIIEKTYHPDNFNKNVVSHIYISKIDYTELLIINTSLSFGMPSYSYFLITKVVFDKVKKEDFSEQQIPKDFTVKDYEDKPPAPDSTDNVIQNYIQLYNFKKQRDYERQKIY